MGAVVVVREGEGVVAVAGGDAGGAERLDDRQGDVGRDRERDGVGIGGAVVGAAGVAGVGHGRVGRGGGRDVVGHGDDGGGAGGEGGEGAVDALAAAGGAAGVALVVGHVGPHQAGVHRVGHVDGVGGGIGAIVGDRDGEGVVAVAGGDAGGAERLDDRQGDVGRDRGVVRAGVVIRVGIVGRAAHGRAVGAQAGRCVGRHRVG